MSHFDRYYQNGSPTFVNGTTHTLTGLLPINIAIFPPIETHAGVCLPNCTLKQPTVKWNAKILDYSYMRILYRRHHDYSMNSLPKSKYVYALFLGFFIVDMYGVRIHMEIRLANLCL
jgi:hypothetical protein